MRTKRNHNSDIPASSTAPAAAFVAERTQVAKYHNLKSGHGFAAEDANHLADLFAGKPASIVGRGNTLNGADRLVGATALQSKYYRTARETLAAAFDGPSGNFRYAGQVLEVPKDQHAEVVRLMRKKIFEGRVPGVSDPSQAPEMVRRGSITYRQAVNTARPGNIDSLIFDAKTHSVTAAGTFGVSFAFTFAMAKWNGKSHKDAIREASWAAVQVGGTVFLTGIVTSQLLRTRAAAAGTVALRSLLKKAPREGLSQILLEALASGATGRTPTGAAAVNQLAKALRSNAAVTAVATVLTSCPDFYRAAFARTISWKQMGKNFAVNAAGAAGGSVGWLGGAACGAAAGTACAPGVGTAVGALVGGIGGALSLGTCCSWGAKKVADLLAKDDAEEMLEVLHRKLAKLAESYCLTSRETRLLSRHVQRKVDTKWLRRLFRENSDSRKRANKFISDEFTPFVERMLCRRPKLRLPGQEKIIRVAADSVLKAVDEREAHAA
jgi:outer membrane lipoprotein SlyB